MLRLSGRQNHLKGRPPKLVQDEIYHDVSYHIGWLGGIYDDTCIRIISWRVTQGEHDQGLPLPQIQASNSMATEVIRHPRSPPDTFRHHPLASFLSPQKWLVGSMPFHAPVMSDVWGVSLEYPSPRSIHGSDLCDETFRNNETFLF